MCAAPLGNRFWEARSSHGRKPIFDNAEQLWDACCQYFQWVEENPLWEMKSYMYQGAPVQDQIPKMRAMTIGGMCLFLDIDQSTWFDYAKREGFTKIAREAEEVIRNQKFVGAAADLLNANIIARDLGLADRSEHTGKDGGPIETKDAAVDQTELARQIAFLLTKPRTDDAAK